MLTLIKYYRKERQMTQEKLAELTGLTQGQIVRIEQGKTDIGLEQIEIFAKALGVKPYELLPEDWRPDQLTPEEKKFIDMLRKSKEAPAQQSTETKAG